MEKELAKIFETLSTIKNYKTIKTAKQVLEGISFRYKTVQFHIVDDTFEEIERASDILGDTKIYSERFSLPGYGITLDDKETGEQILDGDEYQFEIIIGISGEANLDVYYEEVIKVFEKIEKKHDVDVYIEPYEEISEKDYIVHRVFFYTKKEGVFPKE